MHTTSLPTDEFGRYKCIKEQHSIYQSSEGRNGQVTLQLGINQYLNYFELQVRVEGKMHSGVYSTAWKAVTSALKNILNLSSNDLHYGFTCNCTLFKGIYVYSYSCSSSSTLDIAT